MTKLFFVFIALWICTYTYGRMILRGTYDTYLDADGKAKSGTFAEVLSDIDSITWEVERKGKACSIILERLDGTQVGCNVKRYACFQTDSKKLFRSEDIFKGMAFVTSESDAIKMPFTEFRRISFGEAELKDSEEWETFRSTSSEFAEIYNLNGTLVKQIPSVRLFQELSQMKAGKYIVHSENECFKVVIIPK